MEACKRCGWCCTHVIMHLEQRFGKVDRAWLKARGIVIQDKAVIIPSVCANFHYQSMIISENGGAEITGAGCSCYESRPMICRISQCPRPK